MYRNQFVNTLKISTKRIHTALKKLKSDSIVDKRGQHGGYNAISDNKLKKIIEHIQKIPKYKSHYRREQLGDAAYYLESHMTIQKMHYIYKQETEDPVGYEKYKQVFYSHFNFKRKPLKKILVTFVINFRRWSRQVKMKKKGTKYGSNIINTYLNKLQPEIE